MSVPPTHTISEMMKFKAFLAEISQFSSKVFNFYQNLQFCLQVSLNLINIPPKIRAYPLEKIKNQ